MNIKNKKNSIQFKTTSTLIIFSIAILLILWISQILFLTIFYEKYQINNLKQVEQKLLSNQYTTSEIEQIAYENDICIEFVYDSKFYIFNGRNNQCLLNTNNINIKNIINKFILSNKEKDIVMLKNPINKTKSILYNIKLDNGYIFMNTALEDVDSTTSILRNQLIYITLIVIMLALLVSIYLSKMLNEPIIKITKEAKKLSKGNNALKLEKSNIYEIDELSNVLEYASKEINKTDELRRDLLANVSHDLKTPLTMIKAYAEMIRDIDTEDKLRREENLNIIIKETDRLNVLVNDILNLSKLESNAETLDKEEFDLIKLIKDISKQFNIIKDFENYKFKFKTPRKALVYGDYNKISQVIYNLINNAINYTGKDLNVIIEVIEKKKTYLVNIKDTGNGINKEEQKLIWEKYYKNEKNHKRNKIGTGLGLSIVKSILEKHNFVYGVESELNKGTTFYFEIDKVNRNY